MELKSRLYATRVMHHRFMPKEHRFAYNFFSFYLDLDEIDEVVRRIPIISRNAFNVHGFYDKDHIETGAVTVKENVLHYLKEQGTDLTDGRIMLLTHLRCFGYVFNPVSFYFCFDAQDNPVCVIPEVGNTFGEIKPFVLHQDHLKGETFRQIYDKFFYVSPFTRLDDQLDFQVKIPHERLNISVNTVKYNDTILTAVMTGKRRALTAANLWALSFQVPFVTLKVIFLIHWHALRLWLKKVPHYAKTSQPHMQKGVYRAAK